MARIQTSTGTSSSIVSIPAQINAQSLSQNWEVFTGLLYIYNYIILNNYVMTIDADATVVIN
jgi:hypothetical protein